MIFCRMNTGTLFRLGLIGLALHGGMQMLLERAGQTNDATDFVLGSLIGASASLLLIVARRRGREGRPRTGKFDNR